MPYRRTDRIEARLQDNRSRILDAAQQLISDGGWLAAPVNAIAAAAGVATGTVYRYFPSKSELFAEVVARVSQREVDVLGALAASEGSPRTTLRAAVSAFVRRAMKNPRLAYAMIAEPCDSEVDVVRLKYREAISRVLMRIIEAGQARGEFDPLLRSEIAATFVVGAFMEGLVGPLSPVNDTRAINPVAFRREVIALAEQIAGMAVAAVARPLPARKKTQETTP